MAHRFTETQTGNEFITSAAFAGILRETLTACVTQKASYAVAYWTWFYTAAGYLAGIGPVRVATPALKQFAEQNRPTIEKALAPYMKELDAALLQTFHAETARNELADWAALIPPTLE